MFNESRLQKVAILLAVLFVVSGITAGAVYVVRNGVDGLFEKNNNQASSSFHKDSIASFVKKDKNSGKTQIDDERTETLKGLDSMSIEAVSDSIELIPVDTNEVRIHYYGSYQTSNPDYRPELVVDRSSSHLQIKIKYESGIKAVSFSGDLKLDVYIPRQYAGKLEIKSTSGKVTIDELAVDRFEYTNVSGNLNVNHIATKKASLNTTSGMVKLNGQFESFSFNTVSGEISSDDFRSLDTKLGTVSGGVKLSGQPGNINANSISGKLQLKYDTFENDIESDSVSGDVIITLPGNSSFKVDYSTASGNVDSDFPITVSGIKKGNNLKGTVGSGDHTLQVNTVSGSLKIRK